MEYQRVEPQPQVYDIDIMQCKDLEELKKIVSVFKIQMTEQYAKEEGLEHLLVKQPQLQELKLPKLQS
jgi:hypothetical protein